MAYLSVILQSFAARLFRWSRYYYLTNYKKRLGFIDRTSVFKMPSVCSSPNKIYLYENTSIYENATFLISESGESGKFIMKKNSSAAQGLTVITNIHHRNIGEPSSITNESRSYDDNKDTIVEEDVTIGANVTLMAGITIGRGTSIGAGSVCFRSTPPYSVVVGNPAQVVGFSFTPEQVVQHEETLYAPDERIPYDKLVRNFEKYYVNNLSCISHLMNISL